MMISNKKEFYGGIGMLAGFIIILFLIFMPLYGGKNGLNYLDNLFNSISKGSAYYIPAISEEIQGTQMGKKISVTLTYDSESRAGQSAILLNKAQAVAEVNGSQIKLSGDFGQILSASLADADTLFHNQGEELVKRYGMDGRTALFNWWTTLKSMQKALNKQEQFAEGKVVYTVMTRAVECAYNYDGIVPDNISDRMGMVLFALVFYVIYTLWYGYAILFIFEGWGLHISH